MSMTHYMQLLATNQPWNLILFMAVPVILAETVVITELFILFSRQLHGTVRSINRAASIAGGIYFVGVFVYLLFTAVIPLTQGGLWRGPADLIAVGAYLLGVVPLLGLALLDLGVTGRSLNDEQRLKWHAMWAAVFLVVAHVAMIFGMLDPNVLQPGVTTMEPGTMHGH
ncbi:MAG: DUF6803 family protein [Candidatus Dechloromonas phosphoritropha]